MRAAIALFGAAAPGSHGATMKRVAAYDDVEHYAPWGYARTGMERQ